MGSSKIKLAACGIALGIFSVTSAGADGTSKWMIQGGQLDQFFAGNSGVFHAAWQGKAKSGLNQKKSKPADAPQSLIVAPANSGQTGPSKNYLEITANNDGSVTIWEPRFSNPTGIGSLPIDEKSDLTSGVCKLFGFKSAQGYFLKNIPGPAAVAVRINKNGKLSQISRATSKQGLYVFQAIICSVDADIYDPEVASPPPMPTVEQRAEKVFVNDDGSITLYRPFVAGPKNSKFWINFNSSAYETCKYFGFSKYVTVFINKNRSPRIAAINLNGKLYSVAVIPADNSFESLESVVCAH